jgi:hypothetical protein
MLEKLTHADFAGRLEQGFRISSETLSIETVLVRADLLGEGPPPAGRRQPFSLVFRGPREPWLPQRIYRVEHPEIGSFEAFLVPIGPDPSGMRYELIFG